MKKIKKLVSSILLVLIISSLFVVVIVVPKRVLNFKEKLDAHEISNLEESSKDIPDFIIEVIGVYEGEIDKAFADERGIKLYEFDAGIVKEKGEVETAKYLGVKLYDLLYESEVYEYSSLEFKGKDNYASLLKEVDDKTFIIFEKNDKEIDLTLLCVDKDYSDSVEEVSKLLIKNDYTIVENETDEDDGQ